MFCGLWLSVINCHVKKVFVFGGLLTFTELSNMDSRLKTSDSQFLTMLEFMESHNDISKPQPGLQGKVAAHSLWLELADILNSDVTGDSKDYKKWKKVWSDWKTKTKKKAVDLRMAHTGTGGGRRHLSPYELRVLRLMGEKTVVESSKVEEVGLPIIQDPIERESEASTIGTESHQNQTEMFNMSLTRPQVTVEEVPSTPSRRLQPSPRRLSPRRLPPRTLTPRRQLSLRSRPGRQRRRHFTHFERAVSEFVAVEKGRLKIESRRDELHHERELQRIEVDRLRWTYLSRILDIVEKCQPNFIITMCQFKIEDA